MTITDLQKTVDGWIQSTGVRYFNELTNMALLTEEVGELARIMARLGMEGGESFGHAAAAVEFALEGLYLMRRLSKDTDGGTSVYGT